jgi:hypothetical protein
VKNPSKVTRDKISESNRRRVVSSETKEKLSKNNPSHREEVRRKISESLKRRSLSTEEL